MKKKFLIFLFALIAGATGCAGIPVSQDVTDTRSLDMNVQGCTVFTAVSVDGVGSDGRTYHRYGRVFFSPRAVCLDIIRNLPKFRAPSVS